MIDYFSQIFNAAALHLLSKVPGIRVTGELSDQVAVFPCVQMEESRNVPIQQDNGPESRYAGIQIRVRIYVNKASRKIEQARYILSEIDAVFEPLNLRRKTFLAQNGLYNNSAYRIEATYEAVVDVDGFLYRR